MKIAFAHYCSSQDISGVTTWFENFVLRLKKDGLSPLVHLHHFGIKPMQSSLITSLLKKGVSVDVVPRGRSLKKDIIQTLKFLNRAKPDVFLPQCLPSHFFAAAIAGRQGLPWVLPLHSDDPDYWAIAKACPPAKYGGMMVCVSEHISRLAVNGELDHDPVVIPCGVKPAKHLAVYRKRPFQVVYTGRLVESQKRMSLVIDSLIRACRNNSTIAGKIIGSGSAMNSCRQAVAEARLDHRIIFTGCLTPLQVQNELIKAQAILLMSDFEGLPLSLLEAMAVGVVPVVRLIPSGIPEIVHHEETGLLVDEEPENAARALCRLAGDAELWQRCSTAGRNLISEKYSMDVSYQRWLALIETLYVRSTVNYPIDLSKEIFYPDKQQLFSAGYPPPWHWILSKLAHGLKGVS